MVKFKPQMNTDQVKSECGQPSHSQGVMVSLRIFRGGAEGAFAVVAVGEEDHAAFGFCEANQTGIVHRGEDCGVYQFG
jgi:hypothetical protein